MPPFWPCNLFSSLQHVEKCAVTPSVERKCQNTPNQDKRMEIRGSVRHVSSLAWHGAVGFTLAAMGWGAGGVAFRTTAAQKKKEKVKFQIRSQRRTKTEMYLQFEFFLGAVQNKVSSSLSPAVPYRPSALCTRPSLTRDDITLRSAGSGYRNATHRGGPPSFLPHPRNPAVTAYSATV